MAPQVTSFCLVRGRDDIQIANLDEAAQAGTSTQQEIVTHHPVAVTAEVKNEILRQPTLTPACKPFRLKQRECR